jgi:hypothetical protein
VSDWETFPAHLEQLSGIRVLNGGVFGYGLDQIVLRLESLYDTYKPDIVILDFVWDDVLRIDFSSRGRSAKPYFVWAQGKLILRNSPVQPFKDTRNQFSWFQSVFGYSYLMHSIMMRVNGNYWLSEPGSNVRVSCQHFLVGRALLERIAQFSRGKNLKTLVVFQDEGYYQRDFERLISGLSLEGIKVLNLVPLFQEFYARDDAARARFKVKVHMSSEGNKFIARAIYTKLKELRFLK